jgi:hypothetical protein
MADTRQDITAVKTVSNAVLSPNIKLKVGTNVIGYIQNIIETQNRPANATYEVGSLGPVELIPAQPAPVTMSLTKMAVYGRNLVNALLRYAEAVVSSPEVISGGGGLSSVSKASITSWAKGFLAEKGIDSFSGIHTLADAPCGFDIVVEETSPDGTLMTTTFHDCYITNYSRPIAAAGNLTIAETATVTSRWVEYQVTSAGSAS